MPVRKVAWWCVARIVIDQRAIIMKGASLPRERGFIRSPEEGGRGVRYELPLPRMVGGGAHKWMLANRREGIDFFIDLRTSSERSVPTTAPSYKIGVTTDIESIFTKKASSKIGVPTAEQFRIAQFRIAWRPYQWAKRVY